MSGKIIDDPNRADYCTHPGHNPPMHMVIPPGKMYVHTCDACGFEAVMRGSMVRW